jgi:hypothetical protein
LRGIFSVTAIVFSPRIFVESCDDLSVSST